MAGYSDTPLVKKLGIKEGFKIFLVNAPPDYRALTVSVTQEIADGCAGLGFVAEEIIESADGHH
jgi:hypothetical protein